MEAHHLSIFALDGVSSVRFESMRNRYVNTHSLTRSSLSVE